MTLTLGVNNKCCAASSEGVIKRPSGPEFYAEPKQAFEYDFSNYPSFRFKPHCLPQWILLRVALQPSRFGGSHVCAMAAGWGLCRFRPALAGK